MAQLHMKNPKFRFEINKKRFTGPSSYTEKFKSHLRRVYF